MRSLHKIIIILILVIIISSVLFYFSNYSVNVQGYDIINVVTNLDTPWSLAFSKNGILFFTERPGYVKAFYNNTLINLKVENLNVKEIGEGGLLGIALDPNFPNSPYIYLYYTYEEGNLWNRVVRYKFENWSLVNQKILIDKIPAATLHNGGRIKFGPDGKLYITTGDATQRDLAQDINSLAGKILRINHDGSIPEDNPFPNSPVYSYGHRNPQGIDWFDNLMFSSEHGPSGELGYAHDEINFIIKGANYGWPIVVGISNDKRFKDPILDTGEETWAPSGISFYKGNIYPELKNKLLVATLRGKHLRIIEIDFKEIKVLNHYAILSNMLGRIRDVVEGPDGYIYIATSNKDGRGIPALDDDRIVKLIPKNTKAYLNINLIFYAIFVREKN
ncbi:MAG: PQQ-dependent sugar dehydrogenase [Thermoproteota archaeon]|nr:PQQ-dependent sugar dehydrogenase [Thermoproteota archaeon]